VSDLEILIRRTAASVLIRVIVDLGVLIKFRDYLIHSGFTVQEADLAWIAEIASDEINDRMPPRLV
jgi:hypothetical protein